MNDDARYQQAKRHVACLRRFYQHVATFLILATGLALLNFATGGGLWFIWPVSLWAFILAAHAIRTFFLSEQFGPAWEERKIHEYLDDTGSRTSISPRTPSQQP